MSIGEIKLQINGGIKELRDTPAEEAASVLLEMPIETFDTAVTTAKEALFAMKGYYARLRAAGITVDTKATDAADIFAGVGMPDDSEVTGAAYALGNTGHEVGERAALAIEEIDTAFAGLREISDAIRSTHNSLIIDMNEMLIDKAAAIDAATTYQGNL